MADINVLVVVDTKNIKQSNISKTVTLVDDNLDTDSRQDDSQTFTIHARTHEQIKFRITAVDEDTEVIFNKFTWENTSGSSHCMEPMPDFSNAWTGLVVGKAEQHENFSITFSIAGRDDEFTFTLDPKLKVMQSGNGAEI